MHRSMNQNRQQENKLSCVLSCHARNIPMLSLTGYPHKNNKIIFYCNSYKINLNDFNI